MNQGTTLAKVLLNLYARKCTLPLHWSRLPTVMSSRRGCEYGSLAGKHPRFEPDKESLELSQE